MGDDVPEYLLGDIGAVQYLMEADQTSRFRDAMRDAAKERAIDKNDLRGNRHRRKEIPSQSIRHPDHVGGSENEERSLPGLDLKT